MNLGCPPVLLRFWTDRRGATAIEYCLIAAVVSVAVVAGATVIGTKLKMNDFQPVANALS